MEMKKIWIKKTKSFEEAEEFDRSYYLNMSATERLDIVQQLREMYHKIKRGQRKRGKNANRKRLRRIIKVIQ